ncbi:HlyD family efflux transporter periplasmic adaptor subunit [Propionivibrio sp.]|uniref:HlyD family efflux transporter periplasmic adaptor subunit n=1 Tax=Propionivibrio sp. TaxID=2212460 RepID=UPI003BF459B1
MPSTSAEIPALPGLRQDLQLLPGEAQADGAPSWRIHDPVRNRFFDIGWIEFELLQRWREGQAGTALLAEVGEHTPVYPTAEELATLAAFLDQHQLLAPSTVERRDALKRRCAARKLPLWKQLLHHYLFFRIPLLRPDAWLERFTPALAWIFGKTFLTATLVAGVTGLFLASRQSEALSTAFGYFFNLEGALFYALATSVAKLLHELGHALAAKRRGLRIPTVGLAFLVMMPVLYTDTSESWKLSRRADRFAIAGAGIALELMLAAWTTLAWALTQDGALRSAFFLLATTTWIWTLAVNASPFMRFDGYFLLSDLTGLPNLHERSFALARRQLRTTFFGYTSADPEPALAPATQRIMIAFALATWVYRLILFLGIAVLVYTLFFKLLGIFLMAVEIGWFVVLPIIKEIGAIHRDKALWVFRPLPWATLLAGLALLLWLLPIGSEVSAPALARAAHDSAVFAPSSARVLEIKVKTGQAVKRGDVLLRLESPDLASRAERARLRSEGYAAEAARIAANSVQLERRMVIEEQLGEALADETGARAEMAALTLLAPHDGVVRDLPADLVAGRWINARHPLLRVVDAGAAEIEAYLGERQIGAIAVGQAVRFYPSAPSFPVVDGTVTEVDPAAGRGIRHPLLASVHGGGIAATQAAKDTLVAHETIYRVRIHTAEGEPEYAQIVRGTVRIEANLLTIGWAGIAHVASVLVRESGF